MSATPKTDALFNWLSVRDEAPWDGSDVEALLNHARDMEQDAGEWRKLYQAESETLAKAAAALSEINASATCRKEGCYALRPAKCAPDQSLCEHGKGLTDYCQPCGRINSA